MEDYIKRICGVFGVDKLNKDLNDDLKNILGEIFSDYGGDNTFVELCAENGKTEYVKIKGKYENADGEVILETDELEDFILIKKYWQWNYLKKNL